ADGVSVMGLAGVGLTKGAGTPVWRVGTGVALTLGKEPPPPPVVMREVRVVDPAGASVPGAKIVFEDGSALTADASGRVTFPLDRGGFTVTASGLAPATIGKRDTGEPVVLGWVSVPFRVRVATATGEPAAVGVTLDGPTPLELSTPRPSQWAADLMPGTWTLRVRAEGYGLQSREIEIAPRRTREVAIEVVLLPVAGDAKLALDVADPQGQGVAGAEVRLDGVAIGTLAEGRAGIEGLAEKATEVEVDSRYFAQQAATVDLSDGSAEAGFELYYAPGTVRITASGPEGPLSDGLVFVDGPKTLPPVELGERGEKLVQLSTGRWDLLLSSPAFGLQERTVVVLPDGPVPILADFVLRPEEPGTADLVVRVRDVEGRPLDGVEVAVDGSPVGTTGTGGELRLFALPARPVTLGARGPGLLPTSSEVTLRDGPQVATIGLGWEDGSVRVAARNGREPVDAQIDFVGPSSYDGGRLGPPGRRLFTEVPTGDWEILASHSSGMEVAWTTVGGRDGQLADVSIALGGESGDGAVEVAVEDPLGRPVTGAEVWLDGVRLVQTASGGRVRVSGLRTGMRSVEIRHPAFQSHVTPVDIQPGTTLSRTLAWRPGLIDLIVTSGGRPVADAVAFFEGPKPVEPVELGSDGRALVAVGGGDWNILVSSASAGLAEGHAELPAEPAPPRAVQLTLGVEGVLVTVTDGRGRPVPRAQLTLDGVSVGSTDVSGNAVVEVARPGQQLLVSHPSIWPEPPVPVDPGQREQLVEVDWIPRSVRVAATHEGAPVSVWVSASGPGKVAPVAIEGSGELVLPPGRWELVASAEGSALGAVRRFAEVPATGDVAPVAFDLQPARVRQTAEGLELVDVKFAVGADMADATFAPVL
ncbi:MAG: carboxypeptidase regulatory-like domain-containing protein, partial [Alphaproteobacteria bacterium]|nr:carboxypeptidase regulatory-like domain-containing protein [Alphaproteobacteria bacterium]